ncbi:hypothetical protein K08M3_43930 [Vibrio alginolyticus]|uniref:Uncharacterized protein n=1 Tax=Vibrio alginolyticus TaxID=663 RepID=A0A1W6TZ81_VIBAL|nr:MULTISPECIES: hypothetical protein [Vibrio]NAW55783.1 hypothetical protein [Vibrio sp. V41_P2S12T139]NAW93137.1 hypothetical protein [Vibrio sp. V42_P2S4T144]ARP01232.1 hypothetical protein K01M1_44080 [Vibrio alginolyticus]ARP05938.1 hypothetical protein K04M1_44070 [Vibrio alginolyticus]ARP11043.1 hypothetical protein K04M3_44660 [Vibrio alginolyticus]
MQKGSSIEFYQQRPQSRETVGVEEVQQQTQQFGFAEPEMDELLKYSLRTQLEAMLQNQLSTAERQRQLKESFAAAVELVLKETKVEHRTLVQAFQSMYGNACQSLSLAKLTQEELTRQYISTSGLVMSPLNCKHTIKDVYRIKGFACGINKAIQHMLANKSQVKVLYPACGPFAPLLLPLLAHYKQSDRISAEQLQVTLVDIHPGAIKALNQLIADLDIADYIEALVEEDATQFSPTQTFDLLILEAMQHGFSREGFLSIAKHLVQYLHIQGEMIPNQVSVRAMMVIGETEFNQQWEKAEYAHSNHCQPEAIDDRIDLGEILNVNKAMLLRSEIFELDGGIKMLQGNTIELPKDVPDMAKRILAIYSHIDTYGDAMVGQYDSGITHPKPDMTFYVDAKPKAVEHHYFEAKGGDKVSFYYQLTGLPGFVATHG